MIGGNIYVLCHHAVANVYDEEEIWNAVEKNTQTPQFMYYFETLRQGRLSDREEIPDCNEQDSEVLLQRSTRVQSPGDETIAF